MTVKPDGGLGTVSPWRIVAFFVGMALLVVMTMGSWAGTAAAASDPVITNPPGNPTCLDIDASYVRSFKIDTGVLANKSYAAGDPAVVVSNWPGQQITISGLSADGQTFNWAASLPLDAVLVKAGVDNNALYTYLPAATLGTGLTKGPDQQTISHLLFCGAATTPTPSPTPTPAPTPTPTPPGSTPTPTPPPPPPGDFEVVKIIDTDGDPDTFDDWVPGEGWTFEIDVTGGTSTASSVVSDSNGGAMFGVDFNLAGATVEISEILQPDYELLDAECLEFVGEAPTDDLVARLDGETLSIEADAAASYVCFFINGSGGVQAATGTPRLTLPPTDLTVEAETSNFGPTLVVVLLVLGGLVLSAGVATRSPARLRRRPTRRA